MRLKSLYTAILIGSTVALMSSCSAGGDDAGYEYAPNMYHSFGYEPLAQEADKPNTINPNGMNMREPVKNTVARGQMDFAKYAFSVSNESYEASAGLKNPVATSPEVIAEGNTLYNINCTPCHGDKGLGDGTIVADGKFPPPPSYDSDRIKTTPDGKLFYSIRYGKNLMGAYGTTMTPEQIWKVVHYIRTVSGPYKGAATASNASN
ncbi:MAG: cytochrome c [Sediminibacterium sp.]|jgi:mono/diheme cytochrome c family protein|nr:cytochrome c [Sediminibacterium sp.]